jgi:hypothetical protein
LNAIFVSFLKFDTLHMQHGCSVLETLGGEKSGDGQSGAKCCRTHHAGYRSQSDATHVALDSPHCSGLFLIGYMAKNKFDDGNAGWRAAQRTSRQQLTGKFDPVRRRAKLIRRQRLPPA